MSTPRPIGALADIADQFDAILCDIWGVIHDGRRAFEEAGAALSAFAATGKPVILISNVPKPSTSIGPQLDKMGVPRTAWDAIATSGDAIRAEFALRAHRPCFRLGPDWDADLFEGLNLDFALITRAEWIACSGLFDMENETPDSYRPWLKEAAQRRLPMLCANPDLVVRVGDRILPCAGALAAIYAEEGGQVIMAGKPHAPIYGEAFRLLEAVAEAPIAPARILAIGDGPGTDILGANAQGLKSLFVASGVNGDNLDETKILKALQAHNAHADFVIAYLR